MKAYSTKVIDLTRSPAIVARVPPSPRPPPTPMEAAAPAPSVHASDKWETLTEEQQFARHREHSAAGRIYETRCRVCTDASAKRRFEEEEEARKLIARRREAQKLLPLLPPPPPPSLVSTSAADTAAAGDGEPDPDAAYESSLVGSRGHIRGDSVSFEESRANIESSADAEASLVWSGRVVPMEPAISFDVKATLASGPFQPQVNLHLTYFRSTIYNTYWNRLHCI